MRYPGPVRPIVTAVALTAVAAFAACPEVGSPCESSSDCRDLHVCAEGTCRQACNFDSECSGGEWCSAGACIVGARPGGRDAALRDAGEQDRWSLDAPRSPDAAPGADTATLSDVATSDGAALDARLFDLSSTDTSALDAVAPDLSPPDAPAPSAVCDYVFGSAADYTLCASSPERCHFNVTLGGSSCESFCGALGRACVAAYDNPNSAGAECEVAATDSCDLIRGSEICICALEPVRDAGTPDAGGAGWPGGFQRRRAITVHASQVDADLSEFPLAISLQDPDLRHVDSGGQVRGLSGEDLRVRLAETGEELAIEIERWDPYTGVLLMWVGVPLLSSTSDTLLHLYYGNADPDLPARASSEVWDDGFVGVWHLGELGIGAGGAIADSTARGSDGQPLNLDHSDHHAAQLGYGIGFDGVAEAILLSGDELDLPGPLSVSGWGRMNGPLSQDGYQRLYQKGGRSSNVLAFWLEDGSTGTTHGQLCLQVRMASDTMETFCHVLPDFAFGLWFHYAAVYDVVQGELRLYVNGLVVARDALVGEVDTAVAGAQHYLGNWDSDGVAPRNWNGILDEVRLSAAARSSEWIRASYRNQIAPGSFLSLGAAELPVTP